MRIHYIFEPNPESKTTRLVNGIACFGGGLSLLLGGALCLKRDPGHALESFGTAFLCGVPYLLGLAYTYAFKGKRDKDIAAQTLVASLAFGAMGIAAIHEGAVLNVPVEKNQTLTTSAR